jgi:hypothetical protein
MLKSMVFWKQNLIFVRHNILGKGERKMLVQKQKDSVDIEKIV